MTSALEYTVQSGNRGDTGPMAYVAKVAALNARQNRLVTVTDSTGATVDVRFNGQDLLTTTVTQSELFATEEPDPSWLNQLRTYITQDQHTKENKQGNTP